MDLFLSDTLWMAVSAATCMALLLRFEVGLRLLLILTVLPASLLPTQMLGVTGLNAFNPPFVILLLHVLTQGLPPPNSSRKLAIAFWMVVVLFAVAVLRSMLDFDSLAMSEMQALSEGEGMLSYVRDFLIKPAQYLFVIIVATRYLVHEHQQRTVLFQIVVAYSVGCLVVLYNGGLLAEILGGTLPSLKDAGQEISVFGTHPNSAVAEISSVLFVALALVAWGLRGWQRKVAILCLPILGLSILVCGSRAAMLSLCAGALVMALVRGEYRTRAIIVGTCAGAVILGIVLVPSIREKATDVVTEGPWRALYSEREDIWDFLQADIEANFAIGMGRHAIARSHRYDEIKRREGAIDHPHNAYMEVMLDSGIIGFVLVTRLLWLAFRQLRWRLRLATPRSMPVASMAALLALTAFCVAGLTGQTFYPRGYTVFLWLLVMMGTSLPVFQPAGRTVRPGAAPQSAPGMRRRTRSVVPVTDGYPRAGA